MFLCFSRVLFILQNPMRPISFQDFFSFFRGVYTGEFHSQHSIIHEFNENSGSGFDFSYFNGKTEPRWLARIQEYQSINHNPSP